MAVMPLLKPVGFHYSKLHISLYTEERLTKFSVLKENNSTNFLQYLLDPAF